MLVTCVHTELEVDYNANSSLLCSIAVQNGMGWPDSCVCKTLTTHRHFWFIHLGHEKMRLGEKLQILVGRRMVYHAVN